jgi:hypothetical protein
MDVIAAAWNDRRQTRERAEVHVPSFIYLNLPDRPELDGDQVMYIAGHEPDAARARGRVQALEIAKEFYSARPDVPEEVVRAFVFKPWADRLEPWVNEDSSELICPIDLEVICDKQQRSVLDCFKPIAEKLTNQCSMIVKPQFRSVRELMLEHPSLKKPVIECLLRQGETMNLISAPKLGKSWLATDLALTVATGRDWLDTFPTVRGEVLIIDNELHPETLAARIPKVAEARGIAINDVADRVFVENLRGRLKSLPELDPYFHALEPGRFSLIILDALYRLLPSDASENDNALMAGIYNRLDQIAARLACAIVCIHHSSKGLQSGKAITDVGAGAGSQARATDTHLILRPHQEPDAVVLEAAVRSWAPVEPICLRWNFPVWTHDESLDPEALRLDWPKRRTKKPETQPAEPEWTTERFVESFITAEPQGYSDLFDLAGEQGVSNRRAKELLKKAERHGLVHRWEYGPRKPVGFATSPQSEDAR